MVDERDTAPPSEQIQDGREPTDRDAPEPSSVRLVGIDLARALAVFGMFAVHVGPPAAAVGGLGGWLLGLSEGRASALFAVLAGFSLTLIAGRRRPKTGVDGRRAGARIVIRAAVLLVVGTALAVVAGDVVILAYYAVYFLLALPLLRLSFRTLAGLAAVSAVVTPLIQYGAREVLTPGARAAIDALDPLHGISGVGVLDLVLTGFYPAVTWITFVVAGMALGRLDLSSAVVLCRTALAGSALVAFGYGVPVLLTRLIGGDLRALADQPWGRAAEGEKAMAGAVDKTAMFDTLDVPSGADGQSPWTLLLAQPHSSSPFDLIGCVGVALLVIAACVAALSAAPILRRLLVPVTAVGTMSLTVYVGHFLAPTVLGVPFGDTTSANQLLCYIAVAIVFARAWSRLFRRGPLEYILHKATEPTSRLR
ncbi:DUF418 domain-containing protein [Rhodococcoides corynebacterioides]|uniref:DUF418 domain-containing protein n=1 Tax=Rhodococcoides corynebacterioides TaxID=53972 RepID=UPI003F7D4B2C